MQIDMIWVWCLTSPKWVLYSIMLSHLFPLEFGLCDDVEMDAPTITTFDMVIVILLLVCLVCSNTAAQGHFCLFTAVTL